MSDAPRIHDEGRVRTLVLDRPEKKNALSNELAWGIVTAVEEAARNDSVWAFAITGRGDAFYSGLDLGGPGPGASPLSAQGQLLDDTDSGRRAGSSRLVRRHEVTLSPVSVIGRRRCSVTISFERRASLTG